MKPFQESQVVIACTVRNCATYIKTEYRKLSDAFRGFRKVDFIFVESDSTDSTLPVLNGLENKSGNISIITLGRLEEIYPCRIERLAYCRNTYLKELNTNEAYSNAEYVAVADLDGANHLLTSSAVELSLIHI